VKQNYWKQNYILTGTALVLLAAQPLQALTKTEQFTDESWGKTNQIAQTPSIQIKENNPDLQPAPPAPTPQPQSPEDIMVPQPQITIDGQPVPPGGNAPPSQPFLPRAVAPPVGDMSVSNIDTSPTYIDLGTSAKVPRLVLRQAPVREVLSLLARSAGLNIVFVDDQQAAPAAGATPAAAPGSPTISLDLQNQPVGEVFNSVLLVSGLSANRKGNTIFVGSQLPDGARNLISRTIRLNQVRADNAATFLATQGADVQQLVVPITEVRDPETNRVVERREEAAQLQPLTSNTGAPGAGPTSPQLLQGLRAAPDVRLNHITLVGEPRKVEVATSFLTQLDARRRQVAINVKVIDINLTNIQDTNSSFSFGFNDGFVVQDGGTAILNFGGVNPPSATEATSGTFYPTIVPLQVPGATIEPFFDRQLAPFGDVTQGSNDFSNSTAPYARPNFGTNNNAFQPGLSDVQVDDDKITYEYQVPGLYQYPNRFLLTLQSQIQNRNAKILTDPTLVVQEGQEATVQLTQQVLTSITTSIDRESNARTVTPQITDAGLILRVNVERIDDNGFVSFSVNPTISAPDDTVSFSSDIQVQNQITLLNIRSLQSGLVRLQDGQTLIMSGIIQESDRSTVSKVPILGDIPLLGALFRKTNNETDRREVVILLTPKIVDEKAGFGYNYKPGVDATEMLRKQGFTPGGSQP